MLKNIAFLVRNRAVITINYEQLRITANYGYKLPHCVSKHDFPDQFPKKSSRDRATTANVHETLLESFGNQIPKARWNL